MDYRRYSSIHPNANSSALTHTYKADSIGNRLIIRNELLEIINKSSDCKVLNPIKIINVKRSAELTRGGFSPESYPPPVGIGFGTILQILTSSTYTIPSSNVLRVRVRMRMEQQRSVE